MKELSPQAQELFEHAIARLGDIDGRPATMEELAAACASTNINDLLHDLIYLKRTGKHPW